MSNTITSTSSTASASAIASCITVTPGKNGYVPEWACNSNYNYDPSLVAALFFTIVFGITTCLHVYQAIAYKKLRLCWVIIMGATWELASFALRAAGTKNQQSIPLAFTSQILVLLAPMWVNAFDYMVMGRMIYFFVPEQKIWGIKGIKIAKIFVWLDIVSFITQVAGGVMISPGNSASSIMIGIHIYMGGIGLQELCILGFTSIAIKFSLLMRQRERDLASTRSQILDGKPSNWRVLLYVIYASLILITVRIIFRMVEFASGLDASKNPIPYHEAYFMALDALPMFVAIVLMNVVHPGRILQGEGSEFPKVSRKEKKEAKRIIKEARALAKEEKFFLERNKQQELRLLDSV